MIAALDREAFAQTIAERLIGGGVNPPMAAQLAEAVLGDFLDHEQIAFGAEGHAWTVAEAHDLADEELFEWRRAS